MLKCVLNKLGGGYVDQIRVAYDKVQERAVFNLASNLRVS
jgi:hypothetical protein